MTTEGSPRLGYMPGIDGLRAVSVLLVLVFHAGLNWLPGGFVGVSVFFTLSGFLITTLLVTEFENTGRVSLGGFWGRRFRRLVPAALLTIGAVCVWSRFGGPTGPSLRGDAVAAVLNVANWRSAFGERTYADLFVGPSPLLHLWSLAIEEQFYLVLPGVLIAVWAVGVRRRGMVIGFMVAAVGCGLAGFFTASNSLAYYGTHVRAAELFTGCALGAAVGGRLTSIPRFVARTLPLVAVGGLAVLGVVARFASASNDVLVHGGLAALSLASCAAVLGAAVPGPLAGVLGWWPLRQLGRVSYGVYLFHWPVFVEFHERGHTGLVAMVIATAITIGLAGVSFVLIEMPIRARRVLSGRAALVGYPTGAAVVVSLALLFAPVDAGDARFVTSAPMTPVSFTVPVTAAPSLRLPRVLVIGDSTGASLQESLAQAAAGTFDVVGASVFVCPLVRVDAVLLGEGLEYDPPACVDIEVDVPRLIAAYDIDVVVGVYGMMEQVPQRYPNDDQWHVAGSDGYVAYHEREMALLVEVLRRYDVPLVLLDAPYMRPEDDRYGHRPEEVDAWNAVIDGWDRDYAEVFHMDFGRWFPEAGSDADRRARPDSVHVAAEFALQVCRDHVVPQLSAALDEWSATEAGAGADAAG